MPSLSTITSLFKKSPAEQKPPSSIDDRIEQYLQAHPRSTINILILGHPATGKRSLCSRLTTNIYPQESSPHEDGHYRCLVKLPATSVTHDQTITSDPKPPGHEVLLELTTLLANPSIDTASTLRYIVRKNEAYVLVYRVDEAGSFYALEGILKDWVYANRGEMRGIPVFLVANCCDLPRSECFVSEEEGREMAEKLGASGFWMCSAKTGEACDGVLEGIARRVIENRLKDIR